MPAAAKTWHLLPHQPEAARALARRLRVSDVVAQLLVNRGVTDPEAARRFLETPLAGLYPPERLPGAAAAADRLVKAVAAGERVCVHGDYDVDGLTGAAILVLLLSDLGADVDLVIPNRLQDGYGLRGETLRRAKDRGVSLVVTVDCGITCTREAELARQLGVGLIITDHHEPKDRLPDADVLVHPRLPGTDYPFGGLSGAGVAFKLAWAVCQRVSGGTRVTEKYKEFLFDALGLAALGLVADVVPLADENRILVKHGLKRLAAAPTLGLRALIDAAKVTTHAGLRADDVAFRLAPRMNAAGRLGVAATVVELLTTTDSGRAHELASFLEERNAYRQSLERAILAEARDMVETDYGPDAPAFVLYSASWHPGVIGIVAGRLAEQYARPVLIAARREDGLLTGSGRSIPGFALHEALRACGDHLRSHGGHAAAAGFGLEEGNLDALREAFCAYAAERFPEGVPPPRLVLDGEVPLAALTFDLMDDLDRLEPYGADNPRPRFLAGDLRLLDVPRRMGVGERHLSFKVQQGSGRPVRAVAWGMGDRFDELVTGGGRCSLAFTPKVNEWNGSRTIELEVIDFQVGPSTRLD